MHPSAADVDTLKSFEFLDQTIDQLKGELPAYLVNADGVSQVVDLLEWWGSFAPLGKCMQKGDPLPAHFSSC